MLLSVQIENCWVGPIFDSSFDASYFMLFQAAQVRRYPIDSNSIAFDNIFIKKKIEMKLEATWPPFRWLHAAGPSKKWNRPNDYSQHKPVVIIFPFRVHERTRYDCHPTAIISSAMDTTRNDCKPTTIKRGFSEIKILSSLIRLFNPITPSFTP